jgi:hypothetical protein
MRERIVQHAVVAAGLAGIVAGLLLGLTGSYVTDPIGIGLSALLGGVFGVAFLRGIERARTNPR